MDNYQVKYNWIRKECFTKQSYALNKANRLGLISGKTCKVEYDKESDLYWLCFLSGKPVLKQINKTLEDI